MPVEIRELIIRAVVDERPGGREDRTVPEKAPDEAADREALVEECVRQVLKILKKSGER